MEQSKEQPRPTESSTDQGGISKELGTRKEPGTRKEQAAQEGRRKEKAAPNKGKGPKASSKGEEAGAKQGFSILPALAATWRLAAFWPRLRSFLDRLGEKAPNVDPTL
jgi:hypothetical protein